VVRLLAPPGGRRRALRSRRQELLGYVSRHAEAITALDRLRLRVALAARLLLTPGTGAMEKNSEVVIG